MVEDIRGNIGRGNIYNSNTFSLKKNWCNTDTTSRPGVNIILHTSPQAYKTMYLHLIPTVIISGCNQVERLLGIDSVYWVNLKLPEEI